MWGGRHGSSHAWLPPLACQVPQRRAQHWLCVSRWGTLGLGWLVVDLQVHDMCTTRPHDMMQL